jgi:hypothetical protein
MPDSETYIRLLDIAALSDAEEGIRQSLEDADVGRLSPVREFFAKFESGHPELMKKSPRTVH